MPIKGMTDQKVGFPEIGQVRKGAPKPTNKKGPGADLDHFRLTFDQKEAEAATLFASLYPDYPEKLREINIVLPFNDTEQVWEAWYEAYVAGALIARADGEKYIYKVDLINGDIEVKNGKMRDGTELWFDPLVAAGTDYKGELVYAKPVGRLKVIIPELQRLAYLTVLTGSIHDIVNISGQLQAIKRVNDGNIAGIPLVLRRRPKKISTPIPNRWAAQSTNMPEPPKARRVRRVSWLLSVEADPEWVEKKLQHLNDMALSGKGMALLPESVDDSEAGEDWYSETDLEREYCDDVDVAQ